MKTIFKITVFLMFCPFCVIAQGEKPLYPKDTIYVMYQNGKDKKIKNWDYHGKRGVYFSINDKSGKHISVFYPFSQQADTLCSASLKDFHFSDLKEIENREKKWVDQKYKNLKIKPYGGSKNPVFQTYVIEKINGCKLVKYPVIWRNEGVRP